MNQPTTNNRTTNSNVTEQEDALQTRALNDIVADIQSLLNRHELVSQLVEQEAGNRRELIQDLVHRQQLAELGHRINHLHPADLAFVLETLPPSKRDTVWALVEGPIRGATLLEMYEGVREGLLEELGHAELVEIASEMDPEDLAELLEDLPKEQINTILADIKANERERVQAVLAFPEDCVGAHMSLTLVLARQGRTLAQIQNLIRRRADHLPDQFSHVWVVDRAGILQGVLSVKQLLIHPPESVVDDLMNSDPLYFYTSDDIDDAASAFERYDLVSVPVLNHHRRVVGELHVDAVLDVIQDASQNELLARVGLDDEQDLFAPTLDSARTRWLWLGINLCTAFVASRVIGAFEDVIAIIVALAALLPVVASVGGNTGNQTVALTLRGLALNQINTSNFRYLLRREIGVAIINGTLCGLIMAVATYLLYYNLALSLVMCAAMIANLLIAATIGVLVPITLKKLHYDPALGSSILLTFMTDSLGFFVFLGMAALFLF